MIDLEDSHCPLCDAPWFSGTCKQCGFEEAPPDAVTPSAENTKVEFLTGPAGSGKTFTLKQRMAETPNYGVLAATTGVAAVNLDTVTINSLLGYFDTDSLKDRYTTGRPHQRPPPLRGGQG